MKDVAALLERLETLIALHRRNEDMWGDFFESSRERILKDAAFGCEYLIMAWHGIGSYDDGEVVANPLDEQERRKLHPQIYNMAVAIRGA